MRMNSLKKVLAITLFSTAPLVVYQHCGSSDGQAQVSFSKKFPTINSMGGNGGGYEGKPGDGNWVRTNPDINCPKEANALQARIEIDNQKSVLVKDNCETRNFAFSILDPSIKYEFYNPSFFMFGGAIFEIVRPETIPHVNESLCRYKDFTRGIDVVIQNDNSSKLSAKITKGIYLSGAISYVTYDLVAKTVFSNQTVVASNDGSLKLVIHGEPQDYRDLNGVLTTHIDGALKDFPMVCQKMSEKPVLLVDVTGLAAYWKFDQPVSNGGTLIDSIGYAPGNIVTGDSSNKIVAGASGTAFRFDGIDDYIDMGPNVLNMGTQNFSVSLWIKNITTPTTRQVLGDRTDLGGPQNGWNIMQVNDSFDARISDGVNTVISPGITLPTNPSSFQHVVAVYDRTNRVIRIYMNGVLLRTTSTDTVVGSATFARNFVIGASGAIAKDYFFLGDLDEISIWNRVLTNADVQALYQNVVLY